MKVSKSLTAFVNRSFLLFSGLIAAAIAATIWIGPDAFYASYGIALGGDVNLINELKAPAGILFVAGAVIVAGAVRTRFTALSMTIAAILYLSFGGSRLMSFAIDGVPNDSLVSAAAAELIIGSIALIGLFLYRKKIAV